MFRCASFFYWHIFHSSGFHHICNIKCRLDCRYSPQNIFNAKNFNPHKKPISLLNVPICTQGMQRTWWPEAGTIIVTGPYWNTYTHIRLDACVFYTLWTVIHVLLLNVHWDNLILDDVWNVCCLYTCMSFVDIDSDLKSHAFNSLALGRCGCNLKSVIFKLVSGTDTVDCHYNAVHFIMKKIDHVITAPHCILWNCPQCHKTCLVISQH